MGIERLEVRAVKREPVLFRDREAGFVDADAFFGGIGRPRVAGNLKFGSSLILLMRRDLAN